MRKHILVDITTITILNAVMHVFSDIQTHIGLTINYDKASLYRMGSIANTYAKLFTQRKLHWTNDRINTLGVELF